MEIKITGFGQPTRAGVNYIFGKPLGAIARGERQSSEEFVASLKNEPTERQIAQGLGSFVVIAPSEAGWKIFCSAASPGLWYILDQQIQIFEFESEALRQGHQGSAIEGEEVWDMVSSHHLLTRTPFSTLSNRVNRLPPGFSLSIRSNGAVSIAPIFRIDPAKENPPQTAEAFGDLLGITLEAYRESFNELGLLFSGGLDSSVLMAQAHQEGLRWDSVVYKNYGKAPRQLTPIANHLGYSVSLVEQPQGPFDITGFIQNASVGFGTVIATEYLPFDISSAVKNSPQVFVSGQNADTVYSLDHFSPATEIIGGRRVSLLVGSLPRRLLYSRQFLGLNASARQGLAKVLGFGNMPVSCFSDLSLLESLWSGEREHTIPFYGAGTQERSPMNSRWIRDLSTALNVLNLGDDASGLASHGHYGPLRLLRWLRTVQSVHANYHNREIVTGVRTLTPFSEGPLMQFFLHHRLGIVDALNPKRLEKSVYQKITGRTFRSHVRSSKSAKILRPLNKTRVELGNELLIQIHQELRESFPVETHSDVDERIEKILAMNAEDLSAQLVDRRASMRISRLVNWRLVWLAMEGKLQRNGEAYRALRLTNPQPK